MSRSALFLAACLLALATGLRAHPHVFVETRMHVVVENGMALRVEVSWTWDDFFTLLILEDKGLDPDGDGTLSRAELERLRGFDFEVWPEGFEGDLYAYSNGEKVPLAHPVVTGIAVEDGRIVSRHSRALSGVPADGLALEQYDPTYYVAYTLQMPVTVSDGCSAEIVPHDPEEAAGAISDELLSIPEDIFEQLLIGVHFADRVEVACSGSS